jgi:hypothetical protein
LCVDFSSNDTKDHALRAGGSIHIILPASALRVFHVDPHADPAAAARKRGDDAILSDHDGNRRFASPS